MRGHKKKRQTPKEGLKVAGPLRHPGNTAAADLPKYVVLDDDEDDEHDKADLPRAAPSSSWRQKRIAALSKADTDEDDEDDVLPIPPKRRLLRKSEISATERSNDRGTMQTPPRSSATASRKRKLTDKEKGRALLKRRRLGEKPDVNEVESSSSEEGAAEFDSDDDFPVLAEFDDESEAEKTPPRPNPSSGGGKGKGKAKVQATATAAAEETPDSGFDTSDFVVSDDDELGAPSDFRQEMPLEFTVHAHKKLVDHFKEVLDWLVQRRINPAFDREDQVYQIAWRKINDEVRALANSKFVSSIWKENFQLALRSRPHFECWELSRVDPLRLQPCQACGRKKHPAKWRIGLTGHPYNRNSLEDVESDTDDEGRPVQQDDNGNDLEPESRDWYVGGVCYGNAEAAHTLLHWKHALSEWVDEKLEADGCLASAKILEREKMRTKERRNIAHAIVDRWYEAGQVKALYGDFKRNLDEAHTKSTTGGRRSYDK